MQLVQADWRFLAWCLSVERRKLWIQAEYIVAATQTDSIQKTAHEQHGCIELADV